MGEKADLEFSQALVALFKGVVLAKAQPKIWETILVKGRSISDYVAKVGLELVIAEVDACAYLKQRAYGDETAEIPRLIKRHPLSYPVSLLLVLLRKRLMDFGEDSGDSRPIVSKQEIADQMKMYLKETSNEAKQLKDIEMNISRIEQMGFLRTLQGDDGQFEIQPIIRHAVDAQWIADFDNRLEEYRKYALGDSDKKENAE